MDGSTIVAAGGAASMSPTSPVSSRHGHGNGNGHGAIKRKRSSMAGIESSPGSIIDDEHDHEKKRQPGVKRACNECRQQKVSQASSSPPCPGYSLDYAQIADHVFSMRNSFAAMSYRTPSRAARAVTVSNSSARSSPTSSA